MNAPGPMPAPTQILFGQLPTKPSEIAARLRLMAACTADGCHAQFALAPATLRDLARVIETGDAMVSARSAGKLFLDSEVQAALDQGSKLAAQTFRADVNGRIERAMGLGLRFQLSLAGAVGLAAFAAGMAWRLPW